MLKSEDTANVVPAHLALSALSHLLAKTASSQEPTVEQLAAYVKGRLPQGADLSEHVVSAVGEVYVLSVVPAVPDIHVSAGLEHQPLTYPTLRLSWVALSPKKRSRSLRSSMCPCRVLASSI